MEFRSKVTHVSFGWPNNYSEHNIREKTPLNLIFVYRYRHVLKEVIDLKRGKGICGKY
jgi:hypothetical protein